MNLKGVTLLLAVTALCIAALPAQASLTLFQQYVGDYGYAQSRCGLVTQMCSIDLGTRVPVGATITGAYIYSAQYGLSGPFALSVNLNGTALAFAPPVSQRPELLRSCLSTSECHHSTPAPVPSVRRFRSRRTPWIPKTWAPTASAGSYLQVQRPDDREYGRSWIQDGFVSNGNLITLGSPGSPYPGFSPCLPDCASDHERYDLVACAGVTGATTIRRATVNPSGDDNIFEETFWVSGQGNVTTAPEPGTLVMFGSGILGLAGLIRRRYNV